MNEKEMVNFQADQPTANTSRIHFRPQAGFFRRSLNLLLVCSSVFLYSCAGTRKITPETSFGPAELKADFTIFRNVLEENHPSLYWYTSKDAMDDYFDSGLAMIRDSMTLVKFRNLLSYTISKINCGHTTVALPRLQKKRADTSRRKKFPLNIKFWDDTAVIYSNLFRNDTILKRGTIITAINGKPLSFYRDSIFQFLSSDGYNLTNKYQTISNYGGFGAWYRNVFGLSDRFMITYRDSTAREQTIFIPCYDPEKDSLRHLRDLPRLTRKEKKQLRLRPLNNLQIDTAGKTGLLTVTTFTRGNGVRTLIRRSFRRLRKQKIAHLIVDVRNNGGGEVNNATMLSSYLVNEKYRLADSLYAINKRSRYKQYIGHYCRNKLFMTFMSGKRKDGRYHFGYFERHYFKPKQKNHYNGQVYILTGGNSFSATTLFINALKGLPEVTIIGEETGGGSYGNTAWLIPDVTLPATRIRFRLPMYRLVQDKNLPKTGRGIFPDIDARPTVEDIRLGVDPKLNKALEIIRSSQPAPSENH